MCAHRAKAVPSRQNPPCLRYVLLTTCIEAVLQRYYVSQYQLKISFGCAHIILHRLHSVWYIMLIFRNYTSISYWLAFPFSNLLPKQRCNVYESSKYAVLYMCLYHNISKGKNSCKDQVHIHVYPSISSIYVLSKYSNITISVLVQHWLHHTWCIWRGFYRWC